MTPPNQRLLKGFLGGLLFLWGLASSASGQTSTFTQTATKTPTRTPSNSPTLSPSRTPSNSPTLSPTRTPTRTPTNSPTVTVSRTPSNTFTQTATKTPSNTATQSPTKTPTNTATDTFTANPTLTPPCAPFGSMGATTAIGQGTSSNTMRADVFNLAKAATIQGLWLYSGNPGAQAMVGVYSGSGPNIANLIVSSAAQTLITGWNGFPVAPTYLAPGNYWLAYAYKNTGYGVYQNSTVGTNNLAYTSGVLSFGSMPSTMPGPVAYGSSNSDSLYAVYCDAPTATPTITFTPTSTATRTPTPSPTLTGTVLTDTPTNTLSYTATRTPTVTVTHTPTSTPNDTLTPSCGGSAVLFGDTNLAGGPLTAVTPVIMMAYRFSMPSDGTVQTLTLYAAAADAGVTANMALYMDNGGALGALVGQSVFELLSPGWNSFQIPASPLLAGNYWIAYIARHSSIGFSFPGDYTIPQPNSRAFSTSVTSYNFLSSGAAYGPTYVGDFHQPLYASYCPGPVYTATPTSSPTSTPSTTPTLSPTPDLSLTPSCGASAKLFGDTDESGTAAPSAYTAEMWASRYTMPEDGTIDTISLYTLPANAGYQANVALYANDAATTAMTNLICQSGGAAGTPQVLNAGWNTFKVPSSPVTAGDYWLTYIFSSYPVTAYSIVYQTTGPARSSAYAVSVLSWVYPSPASDWPVTYVDQGLLPIYASYCPLTPGSPTNSPTVTPTWTPSNTFTVTATSSPTNSPTVSMTPTASLTATASPSPTTSPTPTISRTPTSTPTNSPTSTPSSTFTVTATPSPTNSPTLSPTPSPSSTATFSPTPTPSPTVSSTATDSPTLSPTRTPTLTPTGTLTPVLTDTPTLTPSDSPTVSPTFTPFTLSTFTPTDTPSLSPTPTPSDSPTISPTWTPSPSATDTPSDTPTVSPTFTPFTLSTFTPSNTPTPSPEGTPPGKKPVLYPNPLKGPGPVTLQMTFDQPHDFVEVKVFTTAFRKVYDDRLSFVGAQTLPYVLDPDHFKGGRAANGLYYVVVSTPSDKWICKLLITR